MGLFEAIMRRRISSANLSGHWPLHQPLFQQNKNGKLVVEKRWISK